MITVTGSARKPIVSDFVVWDASVSTQADTPGAALGELSGWSDKVRSFLTAEGAKDDELTVNPVSTETVTSQGGKLVGYRLTRSFEIRSSRVGEIAKVVEASSKLLAQRSR